MKFQHAVVVDALEPRWLLAALTSGQTITGTLETAATVHTHTIQATAGQPIVAAVGETTTQAFDPSIQIIAPGGASLGSAGGETGVLLNVIAPTTGTYEIRVSDAGSNDTGTYRLTVFTPAEVQTDDDNAGPLESGRRRPSDIVPGDLDVWYTDLTPGQNFFLTIADNSTNDPGDPAVFVFAPDGSTVAGQTSSTGFNLTIPATQTGRYYVVVFENGQNNNGRYAIASVTAPGEQYTGDPDSVPLIPGETRNGDLPTGDLDAWVIPTTAGDTLSFTLTRATGNLAPEIILVAPDGSIITTDNGATSASIEHVADQTGEYYLLARSINAQTGGTFNLQFNQTPGSSGGNGPVLSNNILTINGTAFADLIGLWFDGTQLVTRINGENFSFARSSVQRIEVFAGAGDDLVDLRTIDINTYVFGDDGDDTIFGGAGRDTLTGGAGRNRLYGGDGDDRLNGSNGRDFLFGEGGNDTLYGNGGNDFMDGGGGVDRLFGGDGDDVLFGGGSNDKLYGEGGNDTLYGQGQSDLISGGDGDDVIYGGGGNNTLRGDAGNDTIFARNGLLDLIDGGTGTNSAEVDEFDNLTSIQIVL
jgi:Ca2+-binding RTX toxin-like protein